MAEALGFSQSSVVAEEKCGKVVLKPKSKAERTKKVVKLISSVDIDNIHSVSLNLTQKNCNYEEAHLYVRYIWLINNGELIGINSYILDICWICRF